MRRVAVFTGTRAEYGLLSWVMRGLRDGDGTRLCLLVGGTHLASDFGATVERIEADGFEVDERLDFLVAGDTRAAMAESLARATAQAVGALERQRPDLLVLLGDRYEVLAVASAALALGVPVAHVHGGELTLGAIDDAVRHAVTKLAHLHFTATEAYRRRVIQLGEHPDRVFCVGAPGIDGIRRLDLLEPAALEPVVGLDLTAPYVLMTYHPVTLAGDGGADGLDALLAALDEHPDHRAVITYPNADAGGRAIIARLEAYAAGRPGRVALVTSLGQQRYLSLARHAAAVVGNSSSGIIEVPSLGVPSLDVGDRQRGRIAGDGVVHVGETRAEIAAGLTEVLSPAAAERARASINPYGDGHASERIVDVLAHHPLDGLLEKEFYDVEFTP